MPYIKLQSRNSKSIVRRDTLDVIHWMAGEDEDSKDELLVDLLFKRHEALKRAIARLQEKGFNVDPVQPDTSTSENSKVKPTEEERKLLWSQVYWDAGFTVRAWASNVKAMNDIEGVKLPSYHALEQFRATLMKYEGRMKKSPSDGGYQLINLYGEFNSALRALLSNKILGRYNTQYLDAKGICTSSGMVINIDDPDHRARIRVLFCWGGDQFTSDRSFSIDGDLPVTAVSGMIARIYFDNDIVFQERNVASGKVRFPLALLCYKESDPRFRVDFTAVFDQVQELGKKRAGDIEVHLALTCDLKHAAMLFARNSHAFPCIVCNANKYSIYNLNINHSMTLTLAKMIELSKMESSGQGEVWIPIDPEVFRLDPLHCGTNILNTCNGELETILCVKDDENLAAAVASFAETLGIVLKEPTEEIKKLEDAIRAAEVNRDRECEAMRDEDLKDARQRKLTILLAHPETKAATQAVLDGKLPELTELSEELLEVLATKNPRPNKFVGKKDVWVCYNCSQGYVNTNTLVKHMSEKCARRILEMVNKEHDTEHNTRVDAFIETVMDKECVAQQLVEVDHDIQLRGHVASARAYWAHKVASATKTAERGTIHLIAKSYQAQMEEALKANPMNFDRGTLQDARMEYKRIKDTAAASSLKVKLKTLTKKHKIPFAAVGSLSGNAVHKYLSPKFAEAVRAIPGIPAEVNTILEYINKYRVIHEIITEPEISDPSILKAIVTRNNIDGVNTIEELADVLEARVKEWAAWTEVNLLYFSMQDYRHLLFHAHELLRKYGSVGLFIASGVENRNQLIKKLLAHSSGALTSVENMNLAIKVWMFQTMRWGIPDLQIPAG